MIAAQRDRHAAARQNLGDAVAQHLGPAQRPSSWSTAGLSQMGMGRRRGSDCPGPDLVAQFPQQLVDAGNAIGVGGPSGSQAVALAGIDRGADKGNSAHSSLMSCWTGSFPVCGDFNLIFD